MKNQPPPVEHWGQHPGCVRTVSGAYVNPFNPDPDTIRIEDIAHALSHIPRWGGHLSIHYSVAMHSVRVAERVSEHAAVSGDGPFLLRQALLHDAAEAYMLDLPTPIKVQLPGYIEMERNLLRVILTKFDALDGYGSPNAHAEDLHPIVKKCDREALDWEWANLMLPGIRDGALQTQAVTPWQAKRLFLQAWEFNRKIRLPQ